MRSFGAQAGAAVLLAALAGCGDDSPTRPTPPLALTITCPPAQAATSPDGKPAAITYPPPTVTGGRAPLVTQCAPASGSSFPLGATTVTCTVTDADRRTQSCSFTVTLAPPPYLRYVKFLAFGDSLTVGEDGLPATASGYVPLVVRPEVAYPTKLQESLRARYTAQTPTVTNAGKSGETAGQGALRLPGVIGSTSPEVLLLLEGANDISGGDPLGITRASNGLRAQVKEGRRRGLAVLLATLPPQRAGGPRAGGAPLVVPLNTEIKLLAAQEGATLVDLYAAFNGDLTLIGPDGLHPNEAGFARMAETFFAVIRANHETPFPGATVAALPPSFP
jgi:lysophospholipase L1-like esterase